MSGPSVGRTQIVKAAPTTAPERATNCGGGGGKGGVAGGDGGGGSGWRWQQRSWSFEEWVSRAVGARRACGEWCYYPLSCSQEDRADHGERGREADGDSRRKELDDGDEMFFN